MDAGGCGCCRGREYKLFNGSMYVDNDQQYYTHRTLIRVLMYKDVKFYDTVTEDQYQRVVGGRL
jgi:hypothetical protein